MPGSGIDTAPELRRRRQSAVLPGSRSNPSVPASVVNTIMPTQAIELNCIACSQGRELSITDGVYGGLSERDVRQQIATRDLRKWLKRVGVTYHSPHKFRHGHAVCALKMAKDVSALKAVSHRWCVRYSGRG